MKFMELNTQLLISEREIRLKFILQRAKLLIFFRQMKKSTLLSHMLS